LIEVNHQNYLTCVKELSDIPGIQLIKYDELEKNNYQYIVMEIDKKEFGMERDLLARILNAENIRARRYFFPGCHQMEPYRSYFPNAGLVLPETEKLTLKVLQLPTGTSVGQKDISRICDLIRFVFANRLTIQDRLAK
jgi:dTDP-4-amino-4,6-dideoxygalactose transaminase